MEYKNAVDSYANGDVATAKGLFESLIVSYPDKIECFYYLSKIESKNYNNIPKAIEYMKRAVNIVPFYEAFYELVQYSIIQRDLPKILEYLKQALTYNSQCQSSLKYLRELFPNERHFVKEQETIIKGEYERSADCPQLKYHKIYDADTINRTAPKYIEDFLTEKQKTLLGKAIAHNSVNNYNEGFVLEIPDGRAFIKQSDQTHIISQDGKILKDMLLDGCPAISVEKLPYEVRVANKMLVLTSCWGGNYYHWLTWVVPRICMIEKAGYKINDFDKIVINHTGSKFQLEFFQVLGIPNHKIIAASADGTLLRARTLVTASLPSHLHTPQIVTDSLREKLLNPEYIDDTMPKRLYISRNKSTSRFVLNEAEVMSYLLKYGFTIIYLEDFNVLEQVKIFANADVVISQHGAGLVNLTYCKQNTKVIEIYNEEMKDILDTGYFRIAHNVKLDHYFMFGEPVGTGTASNMTIDMEKLAKTIEMANILPVEEMAISSKKA